MIPTPIYEVQPYLYFSLGLAAVANVSPVFGQICGVVLAVNGLFIWYMRHENRKHWR